jgi:parallel beta-helix repeat protein
MKGYVILIIGMVFIQGITLIDEAWKYPGMESSNQDNKSIIYVDDNNSAGPWDGTQEHPYEHIQDGVDHASAEDTVFVFAGRYHERVNVTKTLHLIGENKSETILYYEFTGQPLWPPSILNICSDGVMVSNFSINLTSGWGRCIILTHASNCKISNNILRGNTFHIGNLSKNNEVYYNNIQSTSYSSIGSFFINMLPSNTTGNVIHHNLFEKRGLYLCGKYTRNNTICDNIFDQCNSTAILNEDTRNNTYARNIITGDLTAYVTGIYFETIQYGLTGGNLVCDNIIRNCSGGGISTEVYGGDTIIGNLIEHCGYGMSISENFVTIKNNTIRYCSVGQDLWFADRPSILEGNLYDHCFEGIEVRECRNVTFTRNTISNNTLGITNTMTRNHDFVSNNFKDNIIDVFQQISRNQWLHNYWDRPRLLPKPIFGYLPFVQFDWLPALKQN